MKRGEERPSNETYIITKNEKVLKAGSMIFASDISKLYF
jgi:hypothetical protein